MKLNRSFLTHTIDDARFLVPVGAEAFHGLVRSNASAGFLLDLLKEETTEEALADAMCAKYDVPRKTAAADVREFLDKLREVGAIEDSPHTP